MFLGVLGTCCMDGACGGDAGTFEIVGYFGWALGLISTCVGIITSQGGSGSLDKMQEDKEKANAQ